MLLFFVFTCHIQDTVIDNLGYIAAFAANFRYARFDYLIVLHITESNLRLTVLQCTEACNICVVRCRLSQQLNDLLVINCKKQAKRKRLGTYAHSQ